MLHISRETSERTAERLLEVLGRSKVTWFCEAYRFEEVPPGRSPAAMDEAAVAWVRNGGRWSRLVPTDPGAADHPYGLVQVRFPEGLDNSGFVGWLASHLKRTLGIGVFVVCGYDEKAGGIYDYTGFPWKLSESVRREVEALRRSGGAAGGSTP